MGQMSSVIVISALAPLRAGHEEASMASLSPLGMLGSVGWLWMMSLSWWATLALVTGQRASGSDVL